MKKVLRRVLLLSALLVMAMAFSASADSKTYQAKTMNFTSTNRVSWTNSFSLTTQTQVYVDVSISNYSGNVYYINNPLRIELVNVGTGNKYHIPNAGVGYDYRYTTSYTLSMSLPSGTYYLMVSSNSALSFSMYCKVRGVASIDLPESVDIQVGKTKKIEVSDDTTITKVVVGKTSIVKLSSYSNKTTPRTITLKGVSNGSTTVTVYGKDGSVDTMTVNVAEAPVLLYDELSMEAGETIYNAVQNISGSTVTWYSTKKSVATVDSKGKITAVSGGTATIKAKFSYGGSSYTLKCSVEVAAEIPEFMTCITYVKGSKKTVKIYVKNLSSAPMTILKSGAKMIYMDDYTSGPKCRIKGNKNIVVKPNQTKTIVFKMLSSGYTGGQDDSYFQYKFKMNGDKYVCRAAEDAVDGVYVLNESFKSANSAWSECWPSVDLD